MPLLSRGGSFVHTASVFLYLDRLRGSFVGIVPARSLPGASTISKSHTSSLGSFGVTITLVISRRVTTVLSSQFQIPTLSTQKLWNISNPRTARIIVNSAHSWFRTVISLTSKSDLSHLFLPSTPLAHRSDELLDRCWLLMWRRIRLFS
jgi:hypothetical protein